MKKSLSIFLTLSMLLTLFLPAVNAQGDDGYVEISFRVGESVLKINGTDVAVETPYVVGEGVTLVPLRVITEAFGATVGWEGSTQTVTLDYPGVNIILQIGNPLAEVNGKAQTLLAAPELPGSSTMVPLRFISETFGATVSYDDATAEILVIKQDKDDTSTLEGGITAARIGDSYYGWSADNSASFELVDRSFDGTLTTFAYNENNYYTLEISKKPSSYNFENDCRQIKSKLSGTENKDITQNHDAQTVLMQAQDATDHYVIYIFNGETYRYMYYGKFDKTATALREEAIRNMTSATATFTDATFDLSTVENGWRTFTNETMRLSMKIPADYHQTGKSTALNEFTFVPLDKSDAVSEIHISVLSKTDTLNAKTLCEQDHANNKSIFNEKYVTFTQPQEMQYNNLSGYEYTYTVLGYEKSRFVRDVFWDAGEYIFNVAVTIKRPNQNADNVSKKIISHIESDAPDATQVGKLIRNSLSNDYKKTIEGKYWTLQIPYLYTQNETKSGMTLHEPVTDTTLHYTFEADVLDGMKISQFIDLKRRNYYDTKASQDIHTLQTIEIDGRQIHSVEFKTNAKNENPQITLIYVMTEGNHAHTLVMQTSELYRSEEAVAEALDILLSAKAK